MPTPPDQAAAPRRHRSLQREHVLAWLRATDTHPTVTQIHVGLEPELPDLSLGTVYRNLEVLVAMGLVDEVASTGGVARYDANTQPHHHFHCDRCERIIDIDLPLPGGLKRRLAKSHQLVAQRVALSFFGLCLACQAEAGPKANDSPRLP